MQVNLKKLEKYSILFFTPIFIVLYLYPPTERIIFNGKDYPMTEFRIDNFFQKEPTARSLIADVFSTPLFLDWYKVSISNKSTQINPYCLIVEPPIVRFSFLKGDPRAYGTDLKEGTFETKHSIYKSEYPDYHLKSGDVVYFIAPSWEEYSISGGIMFGGDCELGTIRLPNDDFKRVDLSIDFDISIKPYWPSWFVRLLILFIFWIFFLSAILSLKNWLKR